MAERELAILIRARDLASKTIRGVNKELGKLGKIADRGLGKAAHNISRLGVAAAGISLAGIAGSIKVAADFESQLNTINTVARRTPEELKAIGQGIRDIAKSTGAPLEELTQGFYDLVSAGVDASQAMTVLKSANTLAIGGLATSAETVDLLTTALNTYGVSAKNQGKESQRFADIFAKSIERGKVTAAELAASFAKVGPIAASNKIEIEELAAGYAQLTAKGVPAAEAATQMAAAMIALQRRTGPLEKLEKQTGKSYLAIAGKKGLVAAFEQLRKDAAKSGVPLIDLVGRVEGLQFALNTTGPEFANYNKNLEAMGDASGTAAQQMAERQKGLNAQLAKLKALAIDAGITIGSKLLPKLTPLAEKAVAFLNTHQADIDKFGDKIAGAFDKAADFAQKIPWGAIGSGLETAARWAGNLMDVFLKLPPEVQTTIIALAGLNKLSGGAVGGIVGELGKGLIKGILGMNAGVVNINAAVVNGGGVPGVGAAAGGGGLLAAALPWAVIGASIAAPIIAGLKISADNSTIAGGVRATADVYLQQNPTTADLQRSLAAVDQGINDIQANPLNVLVSGDALEQLRATRTAITGKIAANQDRLLVASYKTKDDLTRTGLKQAAATNAVRDKMESARIAQVTGAAKTAAAARQAGVAAAAAIRDKDLSVTVRNTINTSITLRETIRSRQTYLRVGNIRTGQIAI